MRVRRVLTVAAAPALLVPGRAGAAPFTTHFAGLQAALAGTLDGLEGEIGPQRAILLVELPYLPEPGTFTLFAETAADPCPPPPPAPPGGQPTEGGSNWGYVMYVDNLRVE